MTRTTNARIAGFCYLAWFPTFYIGMALLGHASGGGDITARLTRISAHPTAMHSVVLLDFVGAFLSIVLAVALYGVTRSLDREVAILAMICRVVEGLTIGLTAATHLALLWVATAHGPDAPVPSVAHALGEYLHFLGSADLGVTGVFYAVGNTLFAWLLLRGRMVPVALAGLGVAASLILVVSLPVELVTAVPGWVATLLWLPAFAYEIPLGFWLLIKGVPALRPQSPNHIPAMAHA